MDVTTKNFQDVLPQVEEAINDAVLLAIDTEFTGLGTRDNLIHALDTPETRYHKLREESANFLPIQFGLCAFQYKEESNSYIYRSFNFYIFPRPFSKQAPDIRFLCQSSSIDFLTSHGFDFNKLFREGISYMSPSDEQRLRDLLAQKHQYIDSQKMSSPAFTSPFGDALSVAKGPPQIPEEHKSYVESVCEKIENFLKTTESTLPLEPTSGYLRKLVFQTAALRFQSSVHLETKTTEKRERYIVVCRTSNDQEFQNKEEARRAREYEEVDEALGFSKVVRMISKSGKVVVGHNMLLDLLHTVHRFVSPLPSDYEDFKSLTKCVLPRLLDTKVMATTYPFREHIYNSTLGDLQKLLEQKPFGKPNVETAEGFPNYNTATSQLHEAGYDAYITGLCVLSMCNFLSTFGKDGKNEPVKPDSPLLTPFLNKIHMMRVIDIPYLNLAGPDLTPCRDHVFHIQFPKDWKASDLNQLFSPYGSIYIAWLDDSSAFVSLYKKDNAADVLKKLVSTDTYRIVSYEEYMYKQALVSTPSSASHYKRALPSSDIDLPLKRKRRSSEDASHNKSQRGSISPIPEEEEEEEENCSNTESNKTKNGEGNTHPKENEEADDEPAAKKMKTTHIRYDSDEEGETKMFEEPETW